MADVSDDKIIALVFLGYELWFFLIAHEQFDDTPKLL